MNFNKKLNKIIIYILLLFLIIGSYIFFEAYRYNKFLGNFKTIFNNNKFSQANNLLLTKEEFNPFKALMLKKDLSKYFINNLDNLKKDLDNKTLSTEEILLKINEINRYGLNKNEVSSFIDSISFLKDSINNYSNGVNLLNNKQYSEAIICFNNISSLSPNYGDSLTYLRECKNQLKDDLFNRCDELCDSDHYKQALNQLYDNAYLFEDDSELKKKIAEIKVKQQEYLDTDSKIAPAISQSFINNISTQNINTLNLKSNTPYLINISIKDQKTYIYRGTSNKWTLDRTFPCSTGIDDQNTPIGSFSIKERGEWFFSDKYKQGGKYWTQIKGNILFHSVPFAEDRTTVLDNTLNKRSSHGCIRLALNDAKWIYDNIPKDTTVIIK
ncbi:L,D-transpeptidase [Clostridium sp. YB-6]|uniref:L,D-transpeptidase n=1 Tax=Clostridium weizhouense TaxID=2859781 RepID=A0ABS7AQT5_9CLOT|nr:L,D-transpeptidase [Clostridium weizhouense]